VSLKKGTKAFNHNKMRRYFFYVLAVLFTLSGCKQTIVSSYQILDVDIDNNSSSYDLKRNFNCSFVPLDINEDCAIRNIGKVLWGSQGFFIADFKLSTIYLFSQDGKFIKKQKSVKSPGPGEFHILYNIDFHNDTLFIMSHNSILFFDSAFKYIGMQSINFYASELISSDTAYIFYNSSSNSAENGMVFSIQKDSHIKINSLMERPYKSTRLNYKETFNITHSGENLLFGNFFSDTIYQLTKKGIEKKFVISYKKIKSGSYRFIEASKDVIPIQLFNSLAESNEAYGIMDFIDNELGIFFNFRYKGNVNYIFNKTKINNVNTTIDVQLDSVDIIPRFTGYGDDYLIFSLEPYEISNNIMDSLTKQGYTINLESNPIILIAK